MIPSVRMVAGSLIVVAAVGAALSWGGQSLTTSDASTLIQPSANSAVLASTPASNGFAEVAKAVTPAVVNITTVTVDPASRGGSFENDLRDRMEEFFGGPGGPFGPHGFRGPLRPGEPRGHRGSGQGSGVIVSSEGYILTNNHVVDGAREVTVTLPDKREFKGRIV
ncbi:MAG TPA: trypsin-like peptidase domain-containing protein, partial [Nitrospira sp.]|nr:trypsin-like peptidase domain-containing protein [Nitrospira sp.]